MTDEAVWNAVRARVIELDPVALAAELVMIPSHPGIERQEEGVVSALERWFVAHEVSVVLDRVLPGRPNLLSRVAADRAGRRLLLCGHTDTVPLNAADPGAGFSGEIAAGRLHGRGSVDMKGAVAAMAAALVALIDQLPQGEVVLAAVVDEEMQSLGAERLVRSGLRAEGAIVGEPTSNRLALGHKGLEWLEVELFGRAAHGGTPEKGINAILAAARFIELVERELKPRFAARAHPLIGPPSLNFGTIQGGDQPSTVAATCRVALDRRTVPSESAAQAMAELAQLLSALEDGMPGLSTRVGRMSGGMETMEHVALDTPADAGVAVAAARAIATLTGRSDPPTSFPAWTDGALLGANAGIPTVILGPGDLSLAHSPRESVAVSEIEEAALLYARIALDFCAGEPSGAKGAEGD
jgi:acetylornithine deacetylase/succinyl-diaminopimelate desuccinylase